MTSFDRERLRAIIAERNTTARAVSRATGGSDSLIRDILSGKSKFARGDTVAKIANVLGVSPAELIAGPAPTETPSPELRLDGLPLLGPIQAGAWLAMDDFNQHEPETIPAAIDRRYPNAHQYLREVQGDSMNARNIIDGDLAHIVEFVASGIGLNTGMIVEVTRTRDDGSLREITLKEVEVTPEGLVLWPRSHNARWKDPIRLDDGEGSNLQVEITGVLLAKITRF